MATIEKAIDNWLLDFFATKMGKESEYTTLQLDEIQIASLRTQADWADWEVSWELPVLGCASRFAHRRPAGHGIGKLRLYKAIPYVLTFIALADDQNAARDVLLELFDRTQSLLSEQTTLTSAGSSIQNLNSKFVRLVHFASEEAGATAAERQAGDTRIRYYKNVADGKTWGAGDYSIVFLTTGA